jgi:glutathione S-transferase
VRLFHSPLAPNARRVSIYLAEKSLDVPLVAVDLAKLEQRRDDYSAVNPFQLVPALELDDGSVIVESIAICRYFEELHPQPPLFGVGARGRAEVEMWQRLAELQLLLPIAMAFRHSHPAMREMENPQIAEYASASKARAMVALERFDAALASRRFLAGDTFSVADITGLIAVEFTRLARIAIPEEMGNLIRWRDEVAARPSAKA